MIENPKTFNQVKTEREERLHPLPSWASNLGQKWNSGCYSVTVLSGNVFDMFPVSENGKTDYVHLKTFLFKRQFKNMISFITYDIGNGLRFATTDMRTDFFRWLSVFDSVEGTSFSRSGLPMEFHKLSIVLKRYFSNISSENRTDGKRGIVLFVEFPEKIIPACEDAAAAMEERAAAVSLMQWASSDDMREMNVAVFLVTEAANRISADITRNPNIAQVVIDLPNEKERLSFLKSPELKYPEGKSLADFSDLSVELLASRTSGLNLVRITGMVMEAVANNSRITNEYIAHKKKRLIEEFCQGLVRFKEPNPKLSLDNVATHTVAKVRLRQMAKLIKNGNGSVLEKGVLIPGRVGVGKSFLVECFASECGLPVMELGDFRSKWVGDTEQQLARILMTVKALGPVIVVIDEVDAVMGNRSDSGDSGVSTRVFASLAAHIGDSSLRGRELWIGMTSRPDLMAIDMKRQGRFGLCLPLFPAEKDEEIVEMFEKVALRDALLITDEILKVIKQSFGKECCRPDLTGSEAESIVKRAIEKALNEGRTGVTDADFKEVIENYVNPLDPRLLNIQDLSAILACSDLRFLPEHYRDFDRIKTHDRLQELLAEVRK